MRYELAIALKYLIPRRRQLSVSVIALLSVLVISLVVWLVVVFLSVMDGLEKTWVDRLVALNAPMRLTPTEAYYDSYYYKSDTISASSDYSVKSIGEKRSSLVAEPYDPATDSEIPYFWSQADRHPDGSLKDLVKGAFDAVYSLPETTGPIPNLTVTDYENTFATMRLRVVGEDSPSSPDSGSRQRLISQLSMLSSFEGQVSRFSSTLQPVTPEDLSHLLELLSLSPDQIRRETPGYEPILEAKAFQQRLKDFFRYAHITHLKPPQEGWRLPLELLPESGEYDVVVIYGGNSSIARILTAGDRNKLSLLLKEALAYGYQAQEATLSFNRLAFRLKLDNQQVIPIPLTAPIYLEGDLMLEATLLSESFAHAREAGDLLFRVFGNLQNVPLSGILPYAGLSVGRAEVQETFSARPDPEPLWVYSVSDGKTPPLFYLPSDSFVGTGVIIAKDFWVSGVRLGERGYLSYFSPQMSSLQEQRQQIYVAGFYDPGLMPVGSKVVMIDKGITSTIRASVGNVDPSFGNGIAIWYDDLDKTTMIKEALLSALGKRGLLSYWKVESYRDYDFSKALVQQLRSDKNLFTLVAMIIILVACSNIISMLILLVKDKKREIGILRSMGASACSIAVIFGLCGLSMGLVSCALGTGAALLTLQHLQTLVDILSAIQGHAAFETAFYGDALPNELSRTALAVVLSATAILSLVAGLIPAIKASMMKPAAILRME